MIKKRLVASLALLASACACQAGTWTLPGVDGHAPSVWVGERNWTQESGNPMSDQGASWELWYQTAPDGDFKPMVFGLAYNYTFAWRSSEGTALSEGHGEDPACHYIGTTLTCPSGKTFPGDGPNARVTFQPGSAGTFQLELDGTATVQAPTAGNARLRVLVLDAAMKTVKEVKGLELKSKEHVAVSETVELKNGESLGVTLQSVNPGPGSCGRSTVVFKTFKVTAKSLAGTTDVTR